MADSQVLSGQVAVVTGAGRGIGAAIARRLAFLGAHVIVTGRTLKPLESTVADIESTGGRATARELDIRSLESVASLAAYVGERFARTDILVNNAGVGGSAKPLHKLTPEEWEKILTTNLRGTFYTIRSFAPMMIQARSGHIVNISSLASKNPLPGGAAYAASKWGLNGLTYSVAEELRGENIRVSVVCPGSVDTGFGPAGRKDPKKMLRPEDVAHVVAMLVTQQPQSFASEVLLRPTQKP
jgi:NAD(P)-dependent dehydrogenase (short-subunit alcohol dehydrogenase family)